MIIESSCSEDKKISALTQLYRFGAYEGWYISRDGRAHLTIKQDILKRIEKYVSQDSDDESLIGIIEKDIKELRDHIDNPVKYIKEDIV